MELKIKEEYLENKNSPLVKFVYRWSNQAVKCRDTNIHSIITQSPFELYSMGFLDYFFEAVLGKNKVMGRYKQIYKDNNRIQNYIYKPFDDFLDDFTNIVEVEQQLVIELEKYIKKPVVVFLNDSYWKLVYLFFKRAHKTNKSFYDKFFKKKNVYFIDGTKLIILDKKKNNQKSKIVIWNSQYKKGFYTFSDLQEIVEYFDAKVIS